ncbi:MAG TPA: succinate--CoA ligase subunit beta [Verrucomicrobiae bacterium]|nr:succinate--CoA ligase subunit beta [Verrucomicrobiae bacterium]
MNIHEYQARQLLQQYGVAVPPGEMCDKPETAKAIAEKLFAGGAKLIVVKSQIHSGGRGKGTFKNGFKGGVKLCKTADEVFENAKAMLGNVLVTKQTGAEGRLVSKLLVALAPDIQKELYLAVLLDRANSRPVIMASTEGGMDIEEVAAKTPEKLIKEYVDPAVGLMPFQTRKIAVALGLKGDLIGQAAKLISGVYKTWWECDASLVEINPLCIVEETGGTSYTSPQKSDSKPDKDSHSSSLRLFAVDAKISFDDNALYRHKNIQEMRDLNEEAPLEIEASKFSLNYIKLDGSIACLVNGAGLAMATMDIIQHYGGMPANFLDVGGGASKEQVTAAFKIILQDPNVKGILVNIFGGIMDCNVIATGIVAAVKETGLKLPLVVRLEGNNVRAGKETLANSGLTLITGDSMADAAQKVVKAVGK